MKVYISGSISNDKHYLEKFARVEKYLEEQGHEVVNPCTLKHDHNKSYEEYMKEDIKELLDCKIIYMIPGWDKSHGAKVEKNIADICGLDAIYGDVR